MWSLSSFKPMSSVSTSLEIVALAWACPLCYCLPFPLLYDNSKIRYILKDPWGNGVTAAIQNNFKIGKHCSLSSLVYVCACVCWWWWQRGIVVIKEAVLQPESIWCNCIRGGVFLSWRGVSDLATEESQM